MDDETIAWPRSETFMPKSANTNLAASIEEDERAWASGEDTCHWHLRLTLPPGAALDAIPKDVRALLASLLDAVSYRHRNMAPEQPLSSLRWRAATGNGHQRVIPDYWKDLQSILERFWQTRLRLELVAPDTLPRISFETSTPAGERAGLGARADAPARPPVVVAVTPDIDSLAAIARILDTQQAPPILVMCDAIAVHRASSHEAFAALLEACRSRIVTMTVHTTMRQELTEAARIPVLDDWRLLHVLAAASVALSCGASETQVPQNGVANLNLPVTVRAISRPAYPPAHPIDPELTSGLSRLLSRMTGSDVWIRNPLVADTPAEIVSDLIAPGPGRLDVSLDEIRGLVANDNTYEERVDHNVSILGALHPGSPLAEHHERKLISDLLLPANPGLGDTYIRAIRELPVMPDREVLSHLGENAARVTTGRDWRLLAIELLRRHAESVRAVLARAMQRHAHEIVAGTLASTCLLMRAKLPGELRAEACAARRWSFRKPGKVPDGWEIPFEQDEPLYLKSSKGLGYIHMLLQSPGSTFSPVELRDALAGHGRLPTGTLGPVADVQAIRDYQRRLIELRADLDVATEHNDIGRRDRILYEIDALEQEIRRCVGLGGRLRQNSDTERARKSVSNAIYRALHQLRTRHPALFRHLSATLKIGNGVSYLRAADSEWDT